MTKPIIPISDREKLYIVREKLNEIIKRINTGGDKGDKGDKGDPGPQGLPGAPGADGREVELQLSGGYIQWRYIGDTLWINLVSVNDITGPAGADGSPGQDGAPGVDGKSVFLRKTSTHIQWQQTDGPWINLIPIDDLKGNDGAPGEKGDKGDQGIPGEKGDKGEDGAPGENGTDGKSAYEIAVDNGFVGDEAQWLASLKGADGRDGADGPKGDKGDQGEPGEKGDPGETGSDGADGREVELRIDGGFIQWRYEGEVSWVNLISLSAITGPKGDKGDPGNDGLPGSDGSDGAPGADGKSVSLRTNSTHIQWMQDGGSWQNLVALADLKGADGQDGAKGDKGDPGDKGDKGDKGDPGTDGVNGSDGADGADGKSAYEVALDNGFVGSEAEWLLSLKGADGEPGQDGAPGQKGDKGDPGPKGDKGDPGPKGDDGKSGATALAQSSVTIQKTGTGSEDTFVSVTIPAGSMGANGRVRISALWEFVPNGAKKTVRMRFGGAAFQEVDIHRVTMVYDCRDICNVGSESNQIGYSISGNTAAGAVTSSVNTTSNVSVVISCEAGAGEVVKLRSYMVELIPLEAS